MIAVLDDEHDIAELAHVVNRRVKQLYERRQDVVGVLCVAGYVGACTGWVDVRHGDLYLLLVGCGVVR